MEFEEIKANIHKRKDIEDKSITENGHLTEIESILLKEGLNEKNVLMSHQFPGLYGVHAESILYSNKNNLEGAIVYINSIQGNKVRRYDYDIYLIGNKEFKERMQKALE
jgi:hypothetical protein